MRSDDVFIVSYPKSGNTWVRFLLANVFYPEAEVDFHTIHELIPEVGNEEIRRSDLSRPRLFKSHAPYQPAYPRVIYILRDGRDVYTSYFHYRQPDLDEETTFEEFLEEDQWPCRWAEHVRGWMQLNRRMRFTLYDSKISRKTVPVNSGEWCHSLVEMTFLSLEFERLQRNAAFVT